MGKPTKEDIAMLSDPAYDDMTIILDDGRVVNGTTEMLELCQVVSDLADKLAAADIAVECLPRLKELANHMISGINRAINYQPDHDARVAAIALALANGYVKAEDYEALKAKLAEVTDQLEDATDTLDQIEAESACFDGLARSAGYVKLEPGQVVVNASDVGDALDALCDTCAGNCEMCPTREILFAIKEARDARV